MTVIIPKEAAGKRLSDYLSEVGIPYLAPCGGNGTCGKCTVTVLDGGFARLGAPCQPLVPDESGKVPACRAVCTETGATILVDAPVGRDVSESAGVGGEHTPFADPTLPREGSETANAIQADGGEQVRYGVALDIGTTTLAMALVDLDSQLTLKTASALNPQSGFGADVMSRIDACVKGHLATMQYLLLTAVKKLLERLFEGACREGLAVQGSAFEIEKMTVIGNPTMLHIFCGISPEGMGQYPFTPAFLAEKTLRGEELGLPVRTVIVLPSASAFIGSDAVGGAALLNLFGSEKSAILLDVGTNGEMILSHRGKLYAASCAAGPALEGAGISCGMGGLEGAVSSVKLTEDGIVFQTVGDAYPRGISGSGLVDLAAVLLALGILDESGAMDGTYRLVGKHRTAKGIGQSMPTSVTLIGEDVRALQLVKSAFRAGMETLLSEAELSCEGLDATYIAGGLGYYMDLDSAAKIGLIPPAVLPGAKALGNTALTAAIRAACDGRFIEKMRKIAQSCVTIELNEKAIFSELFMEYMFFE